MKLKFLTLAGMAALLTVGTGAAFAEGNSGNHDGDRTGMMLENDINPAAGQANALGYTQLDDDNYTVTQYGLTIGQLEDMDVFGPNGDKIGEVEDILIDEDRKVAAIAIETEGFLGLGGADKVVVLGDLNFENDRFTTAMTEEQLKALPDWED